MNSLNILAGKLNAGYHASDGAPVTGFLKDELHDILPFIRESVEFRLDA